MHMPKWVVRHHDPRSSTRRVLLVALLVAAVGALLFSAGRMAAADDRRAAIEAERGLAAARAELATLTERLALAERSAQVDRQAHEELRSTLAGLNSEILQLREELAFYRGIVSPADARRGVRAHGLDLVAILVTHHHPDHTGGLRALTAARRIPVYGPAGERIEHVSEAVAEGDMVVLPELELSFEVLEVPGHTKTHIAFHAPRLLFPGDTLFSAGCGRLLGGTAAQLHASLQRLAALPDDTAVYCTHEYTLANLVFSCEAEPDNSERDGWHEACRALRASGKPTLPTTIDREKRINPFLRTSAPGVVQAITARKGTKPSDALECFTALRAWKDVF